MLASLPAGANTLFIQVRGRGRRGNGRGEEGTSDKAKGKGGKVNGKYKGLGVLGECV